MMTLDTVKAFEGLAEIDFDMDDSGHFYIKQDDDWIVLNHHTLVELSEKLAKQVDRLS